MSIEKHKYNTCLAGYFSVQPLFIDGDQQKKPHVRKCMELPFQLTKAELWVELCSTFCNLHFIEAKCLIADGYFSVLSDFQLALEFCTKSSKREVLMTIGTFIASEANCLREAPQFLFQQALLYPPDSLLRKVGIDHVNKNQTLPYAISQDIIRESGNDYLIPLYTLKLSGIISEISLDKKLLINISNEDVVFYNTLSGKIFRKFSVPAGFEKPEKIEFDYERHLIIARFRSGVFFFSEVTKQPIFWIQEMSPPVSYDFSVDMTRVVLGSWHKFEIWDVNQRQRIIEVCDPLLLFEGAVYNPGIGLIQGGFGTDEVAECRFDETETLIATKSGTLVSMWDAISGIKLDYSDDEINKILHRPFQKKDLKVSQSVSDLVFKFLGQNLAVFEKAHKVKNKGMSQMDFNEDFQPVVDEFSQTYAQQDIIPYPSDLLHKLNSESGDGQYEATVGDDGTLLVLQLQPLSFLYPDRERAIIRIWTDNRLTKEDKNKIVWDETVHGPIISLNPSERYWIKRLPQGPLRIDPFRHSVKNTEKEEEFWEAGAFVKCPRCLSRQNINKFELNTVINCCFCGQALSVSSLVLNSPSSCWDEMRQSLRVRCKVSSPTSLTITDGRGKTLTCDLVTLINVWENTNMPYNAFDSACSHILGGFANDLRNTLQISKEQISSVITIIDEQASGHKYPTKAEYLIRLNGDLLQSGNEWT